MKNIPFDEFEKHTLILKETTLLRSIDCDASGHLRPDAALVIMQEMAAAHADRLGCGRSELLKKNIIWVLARSAVEFVALPHIGSRVTAVTWPGPSAHGLFPRHFAFYENGSHIGSATTMWMLVDSVSHCAIKNAAEAAPFPVPEGLCAPLPAPRRIKKESSPLRTETRSCRYCDLDANGHMNNTRYAQWAADALGPVQTPKSYQINYITEIHPDEIITLEICQNSAFGYGSDGRSTFEAQMI